MPAIGSTPGGDPPQGSMSAPHAMERPPPQRRRRAWLGCGIAVITLAAFAPVWNCDFVNWDDDENFLNNLRYRGLSAAHLRWMFTTFHGGHYQPLSWLTLALDYTCWGMQPRGYHLTNLLLHTANALLVYALALALLSRPLRPPHAAARQPSDAPWLGLAAAAAALCFAVHPLRVESVAWVTERRDVLSGFFLLLTVLAYLRMVDARPTRARRTWLAGSLVCFALSLLSEAWGMTLPIVLLLLDTYPLPRWRRGGPDAARRILLEKLPYLGLAVATMVLASFTVRSAGEVRTLAEHGVAARAMQAAYGLLFYLWKTLVPVHLSPLYPLRPDFNPADPLYLFCGLAVVVLSAVVWRWRRRRPWLLAAWAGYVVLVSPVLGFLQSGPQLVADRYTYLACLPWALLAGAAVARLPPRHRALGGSGLVVVGLVLAGLTFQQTRVWTNGFTLWDHALRVDPSNYVAAVNRGWLQLHRGDADGALAYYDAALRSNPRFANAYRNRGFLLHARGELQAAIADYNTALAIDPRSAVTYFNRGLARQTLGDADGALADYSMALAAPAPNPQAFANRAGLRRARGDLAGAIDDLDKALQLVPADSPYHRQLEGQLQDARAQARSLH